jgi:hypothetical protein
LGGGGCGPAPCSGTNTSCLIIELNNNDIAVLCCALCCVLCRPQDLLATAALYNTGDWVACSDALRAYVSTTITGERVLVCAGWGERGGGGGVWPHGVCVWVGGPIWLLHNMG